jgi:hypothetical protein
LLDIAPGRLRSVRVGRSHVNFPPNEPPVEIGKVAKAMAHPIRGKLYIAVADKPGLSARELAERIEEPVEKVRYHLRILASDRLIGVKEEAKRRGVSERYYHVLREPIVHPDEDAVLSQKERRTVTLGIIRWIFGDAMRAMSSQTLVARPDRVVIRIGREVDLRGWEELSRIHLRASKEARQVVARSAVRLEGGSGEGIPITSAILLFETPG